MTRIIDNGSFGMFDWFNQLGPDSYRLDACVGYFNLRSWGNTREALQKMLAHENTKPELARVRLLIGMAIPPAQGLKDELNPLGITLPVSDRARAQVRAREAVRHYAQQLTWGLHTRVEQESLQALLEDLRSGFLQISFYTRKPLHAKLYIFHQPGARGTTKVTTVGSSNFTPSGLGRNGELNLEESDREIAAALDTVFSDWWDDTFTVDVTNELILALENCWAIAQEPSPRTVHLKLAYELARDAREGKNLVIPEKIAQQLTKWQLAAVQIATRIVRQRELAVIGDVVGLGKTLTGAAIGAAFGESVLLLCPVNLKPMWDKILDTYDIPHKVVPLSKVAADLPELRAYRLVIIDESHNLRNSDTIAWKAIQQYISNAGSSLVLLTATMYNAKHQDIADQLKLKLSGDYDLGFRPEAYIESLGVDGAALLAEQVNGKLTSLAAFEKSDKAEDWQRLLGQFLIRRTRKYLTETYSKIDPLTGDVYFEFNDGERFHFPERIAVPLPYDGGPKDPGDRLASADVFDTIYDLNYARYQPVKYLTPELKSDHELVQDSPLRTLLKDIKRGRANVGFIRTTVLKRLASSPMAFFITLEKMLVRGHILRYALEAELPIPLGTLDDKAYQSEEDMSDADFENWAEELDVSIPASWARNFQLDRWDEIAKQKYSALVANTPRGLRWAPIEWFQKDAFRRDLEEDLTDLQDILDKHGEWVPQNDTKIKALAELVNNLQPAEKLLVFSEYKDTVDYVFKHLAPLCPDATIGAVSGATSDPTIFARRFSPKSNQEFGGLPIGSTELQVLISTDVLSEGQNLQDAALVLNWDLPWTIIRLIQRAGRVDRVGQKSRTIRIMSFLPHEGVDERLRLMKALAKRLKTNQEILGGNERFFDLDSDEFDTGSIFDGRSLTIDDEGDVDFGSLALTIWEGATADEQAQALRLPLGAATARKAKPGAPKYVTYAKATTSDGSTIDLLASLAQDDSTKMITQLEALNLTASAADEPTIELSSDHLNEIAKLVQEQILEQAKKPMVLLSHGVRKRLFEFLETLESNPDLDVSDKSVASQILTELPTKPISNDIQERLGELLRTRNRRGISNTFAPIRDYYLNNELFDSNEVHQTDLTIMLSMGMVP